ncbi:MAG: aminotransferase class I/II-fold pyridoxal phosphate-dependent enzyme [Acidobacteriota bacterium]|nr:aminotransferase class I/II-fold pyridoxal phosphate-dependent enzyme [Blastocatellia bacterium]MDW8238713.1 aminotransferase class I/II-fold pyridoxal phosphate-dependent enzyme [Acidobacteriota bacterium]
MSNKHQPDIRAITRLVPRSGNLVQGQSELPIDPALARAACEIITASENHYSPSEGDAQLRAAVAAKIAAFNGVRVDPDATPMELLITPGGTGGVVAVAHTYLRGAAALVFEPYYPYHRRVIGDLGGHTEVFPLRGPSLELDGDALKTHCRQLKDRSSFPLRAIIVCTPANPTGKVFSQDELEIIASICQELDLLCLADEVYEHHVVGERKHISIASLPGMWERTITINSFSKSWNISGWRIGYTYGSGSLVAPLNNAINVLYVCTPTPLQKALARVLMADPGYYPRLRDQFMARRRFAAHTLAEVGFQVYESGSAFYLWARIPDRFDDAMQLNQFLMERAGVAAVPGSAFADGDEWRRYMRVCIAREDEILYGALEKVRQALADA